MLRVLLRERPTTSPMKPSLACSSLRLASVTSVCPQIPHTRLALRLTILYISRCPAGWPPRRSRCNSGPRATWWSMVSRRPTSRDALWRAVPSAPFNALLRARDAVRAWNGWDSDQRHMPVCQRSGCKLLTHLVGAGITHDTDWHVVSSLGRYYAYTPILVLRRYSPLA